ncbi:hypothetical protein [Amycolatopsis nalaikhensis]|uniref:Uncharacterized protein n=1 Tax=Amycolatopsis nalaikhensis TaxID=715472 RepID=A0ABY8XAE3_9PSEU|nr:hypothetical protein [Amycolatopsis sp. 2-2]WIV52870.1 hypothetical protein QP939_28415 [Amycolatopsis sp. 2-2]
MTEPTIAIPAGYRTTHLRGLWAHADCRECGGTGEFLVSDRDDPIEPWDPDEPATWYPQPCDCLWSPPPEILRALDAAQTRLWRHRTRMREVLDAIGPRQAGGAYWDAYWHRRYVVESVAIRFRDGDLTEPGWSITILWDNGQRCTHRTPWDPRHDSTSSPALSPGPAPAPPELRYPGTVCRWRRSRFRLVRAVHRPFCRC